ncbi:hypothetical protein [Novosphingobium sp. M1R2S20]|uniref:DNA (Cytosine-5)-methyltransferase 1 n=1 Tax=Novosphingobium rhizovicinum TaxID=3228928 RepID=A0ABV3RDX3_9SPHN
MRGLAVILFARSGVMRSAFNAVGWDAIEVDTAPPQRLGMHWQGSAFDFMETRMWRAADLAVLHPVCTYLSGSGLHWNKRSHGREACTLWSLDQVRRLFERVERDRKPAVFENPVGIIGTKIEPCTQTVQPYQFGDDASKRTCLWMKNGLPPLTIPARSEWVPGRLVEQSGKTVERWANQTDSGQNRLGPSEERAGMRSETYPGIAAAIARQMTAHLEQQLPLLEAA